MKYYVSAVPGPMPPTPEQFDASLSWLDHKLSDGTFDSVFGYMEGGGFAVVNAESHHDVLELMTEYPLFGMVTWDVRPLLEFKEGTDLVRAKLVEAHAVFAAH